MTNINKQFYMAKWFKRLYGEKCKSETVESMKIRAI